MLVLSRKVGESILIGENIHLKVISVDGETVKLGIDAPKTVSVFRKELYETIQQANESAVLSKDVMADLHDWMKKSRS